jgi:hypothetical protein
MAAFASRPLSLTFTKRFGWTPHSTGVRPCQAKRPGFRKGEYLTGLTRDKALGVRIQQALAIDHLRNEMRLLGAASVGPIDMGTQVMSVARRFEPLLHEAHFRQSASDHIDGGTEQVNP